MYAFRGHVLSCFAQPSRANHTSRTVASELHWLPCKGSCTSGSKRQLCPLYRHCSGPHLLLNSSGVSQQHVQLGGIQREQLILHRSWQLAAVPTHSLTHPAVIVVVFGALAQKLRLGLLCLQLQVLLQALAAPLLHPAFALARITLAIYMMVAQGQLCL